MAQEEPRLFFIHGMKQTPKFNLNTMAAGHEVMPVPCPQCGRDTLLAFKKGETADQIEKRKEGLLCAECRVSQEQAKYYIDRMESNVGAWESVCPARFRDTDINHQDLYKGFVQTALEWEYGPIGLGFLSRDSGNGKTRSLFLALYKAHQAGKSIYAIRHTRFVGLVQAAYSGDERGPALREMEKLREVDCLVIDDIGKPPPTERSDAELIDILDGRSWDEKPVLWSSNGSSEWLKKRLGPDRGGPIVRRLNEFSKIVYFNAK